MRKRESTITAEIGQFSILGAALKLFSMLLMLALAAVLMLAVVLRIRYGKVVKGYYSDAVNIVEKSTPDTFHLNETSFVYASNGTLLGKLRQDAECEYVEYSNLPEDVIDAFVSVEDRRFYKHSGVDILSTVKAALLLLRSDEITRGGSTITQQLARNVFLNFEKSYERKLREIFLAIELEKKYTKEQIIEYYVNNINYGNGYYGIGAASHGYFNRSVNELSCAQIALLCAIPNNPTFYNPRINLQNTVTRRNLILKRMRDQGHLTEKEYLTAINTSAKLVEVKTSFHNYESSYAVKCAVEYFMELSGFQFEYSWTDMGAYLRYREQYSEQYDECRTKLYTGGYTIRTSLNLGVQRSLQRYLDSALLKFESKTADDVFKMQGAGVVINNKNGKVIAAVGGRTQKELGDIYSLNRSYQAYRQPGSAIKPLIVYTPAFERGYSPDSIVDDVYFDGGPKNSNGKYDGAVTLRYAVEKSKNVAAWKLFSEIGYRNGISYVQKMHFGKMTPNDYYAPASLGGLYYGVTVEEMASGYAAIANDGVFREPSCIVSLTDRDGIELYVESEGVRVYRKNAARMMTDVLSGVASSGTASGLEIVSNPDMPVACKTGTTNENTCGWFCGYTPYYTCAVYVGTDSAESFPELSGSSYPKEIWESIQSYLCRNKKVLQFKKYVSGSNANNAESIAGKKSVMGTGEDDNSDKYDKSSSARKSQQQIQGKQQESQQKPQQKIQEIEQESQQEAQAENTVCEGEINSGFYSSDEETDEGSEADKEISEKQHGESGNASSAEWDREVSDDAVSLENTIAEEEKM